MEGEPSWTTYSFTDIGSEVPEFESFSDLLDEGSKQNAMVSLDVLLPDDLLERILANLPIASILRAGSVCKRWNEIVKSRRYLWNSSNVSPQKPWYFMFTKSGEPIGYAYDPIFRKWYNVELPCIGTSNWLISSSNGLVCFLDNDSRSNMFVCNPITKTSKLFERWDPASCDYCALAISVDRKTHNYTITIAKSKQIPENFFQWNISIQLYNSEEGNWETAVTEELMGWRGGDECVICNGVLYLLIYSTGGGMGRPENRHGLITYDLSKRSHKSSTDLLIQTFIPVPCILTCGRLMNLKDKLVMVGGIGKQDRSDIIRGIGIWVLNGNEWKEVSRMPHKFFHGFGEFDEVFASSGTFELIYIHSYGAPTLLVFDMNQKQWRWSQKCPVTKRFPLQLFKGFCFEPRLEVAP